MENFYKIYHLEESVLRQLLYFLTRYSDYYLL